MIIAIDFDGTIVEDQYPMIGRPIPFAIDVLRKLLNDNHQLILWTVREGNYLEEAVAYCRERGVEFYAVNKLSPYNNENMLMSRKIAADMFIDDRNVGGLPDWGLIYEMVSKGKTWENAFDIDKELPQKKAGFFGQLFG